MKEEWEEKEGAGVKDSAIKYDSGETKIGESGLTRDVSNNATLRNDPPSPLVLNPEQILDTYVDSFGPVTIA